MLATFRQIVGVGTDDSDQRLQATVAGQQCKPAKRRQRQLWKKALVTEQEKFEAQTEDRDNSSAGQGRKIVTGQGGQHSTAVGRRNSSQCAQKNEVGTLGTLPQKAPIMQKFVKTVAAWKCPKGG